MVLSSESEAVKVRPKSHHSKEVGGGEVTQKDLNARVKIEKLKTNNKLTCSNEKSDVERVYATNHLFIGCVGLQVL